jgi:mercuric ion transport protein
MKKFIMATPSFIVSGVAALPVLTCPACWPLYAGLLSALGLSFVNYMPFLLPVTAVLLFISLIPLIWKARQRWGYWPVATGFIGTTLILYGKLWLLSLLLYYTGIVILLVASIWNIWPRRKKKKCHRCIFETT